MSSYRFKLRLLCFQHRWVQRVCNFFAGENLHVNHLKTYREKNAIGPLQRDEALFLNGLIRVLKPRVLVEFGFDTGHSAYNFLQALDGTGELHSYDIADYSTDVARRGFAGFPNFHFHQKSQADFTWDDVGRKPVDFVFIDASHNLELNQKTFAALLPALSEDAILAVHDTGTWVKEHFSAKNQTYVEKGGGRWVNEHELEHTPDERAFVNWIGAQHPEFQVIHCHSRNCLRHGLTLLQKKRVLPTSAAY
jgi:predicted O-methyltransferase YrrM